MMISLLSSMVPVRVAPFLSLGNESVFNAADQVNILVHDTGIFC